MLIWLINFVCGLLLRSIFVGAFIKLYDRL
jgi:hypothetical protein